MPIVALGFIMFALDKPVDGDQVVSEVANNPVLVTLGLNCTLEFLQAIIVSGNPIIFTHCAWAVIKVLQKIAINDNKRFNMFFK